MTDRGSTPQRAQQSGPAAAVNDHENAGSDRTGSRGADVTPAVRSRSPQSPGSRVALRNWRISTRLVSLLALPVVAATTLGALRIQTSLENVDQLDNMKLLTEMTEQATQLASALQEERDRSAGPLIATGNDKDDSVVAPRQKTDQAFQAFKEATGDIDGSDEVMRGVQSTVLDITRQLNDIQDIRDRAYDNPNYVSQTVNSYNQLIESLLSLSQDMAQATSNSQMIQSTRALAAFSSAKEYASIQRAIISAGLAHKGGPKLSETDRLYARTASESESAELSSFDQIYGEKRAEELTSALTGGIVNIKSADAYRDRVLKNADGIKSENRSYVDWFDQDLSKIDYMGKIEDTLLSQMEQQARELRASAQRDAFVNGAVVLLVLGISLVGAFVVARSMVRSLRRLQDTAQDVARKRLPELVRQMSEADPQDVDTSVESVGVHSRDEIGRVAAAFDDVHREAVRLAGEQALLRGNVNAMFTNLSRRSQGLIQRQLSLISELESREADPDQLSSLFKLDHLATRMRRNGENLLVLAGEEPGRRWTRPVPLVDVLRAAASEVEQYERIELNSVPATEVAGRVVNDLVHLLAELLENATSFSSPQTKVKVTGHALPDGRVLVEIHDTGIGLSPEDLSAINERLANPPTVDVSVSRRMGLFVVGRLSLRHGIRIQLRPSDSGGTTALVMLPVDVAQGGSQGDRSRSGAGPAAGGQAGGALAGGGGPKGGNLAAALQRGPSGPAGTGPGGPGGPGPDGPNRAGAAPGRGQVAGSGPRPALPGAGGAPGAGAFGRGNPSGPGGPGPNTLGSGLLFGNGNGPDPDDPSRAAAGPPGERGTDGRGDTSRFGRPEPAEPTSGGLPGRPPWNGRPSDDPAGGTSPGTIDFGRPQSGSDTGQFARPQSGSETGEFGRPQPGSDTGQFAHPQSGSDTGEYARPQADTDTTRFSRSPQGTDAGAFARPQAGGPAPFARGEWGQLPPGGGRPEQGRAEEQRPDEQQRPSWASAAGPDDTPRGHDDPQDTGEYAQPGYAGTGGGQGFPGRPEVQARGGRQDAQAPESGAYQLPSGPQDPSQLASQPPAYDQDFGIPSGPPPAADAPTPIFESMESNWFRAGHAARAQSAAQPSSVGAPRPGGQPASAVPPMPQRQVARGAAESAPHHSAQSSPGTAGPAWGASPNDERWRRAEQVRQPAAGGVTTSGLPRRVPRANLVAGTAQASQPPAQTGPQVSRAPDDVRGRLTNLRRGIQQGRQAGTDGRGFGPHHQQER